LAFIGIGWFDLGFNGFDHWSLNGNWIIGFNWIFLDFSFVTAKMQDEAGMARLELPPIFPTCYKLINHRTSFVMQEGLLSLTCSAELPAHHLIH